MSASPDPGQRWSAQGYAANARFVADLGMPVLDLLNPQPGEAVLDLGCGDGVLTEKIATRGAQVIGVDASEALVAAARARGLEVTHADGHALPFTGRFDAVFSNAALHWMTRPAAVIDGVKRALKPKGRFVGEFGGFGNVAAIRAALHSVLKARGLDPQAANPWYFPSDTAYRDLLEAHGFTVAYAVLIPRPTPLPTGIAGWFATFAATYLNALPDGQRQAALDEAINLLRPILCDERGVWCADYVRLRFVAFLR